MVIDRFGGRSGIRTLGLLESTINQPWMIIKFGTDESKALYTRTWYY